MRAKPVPSRPRPKAPVVSGWSTDPERTSAGHRKGSRLGLQNRVSKRAAEKKPFPEVKIQN